MTESTASLSSPAEQPTAQSVRDRLIEVAARHFAEHGIQGASQRAIQREVGVNSAVANYYFGSKEALYRAIVDAALSRVEKRRMAGLAELSAELTPQQSARKLLRAYLGALLEGAATELGYNYLRIVINIHLTLPDAAVDVLEERLHPVRELYVDAFTKLFPNASRNRIYEVLRYAVGLTAMAPIGTGQTSFSEKTINRMIDDVVTVSTIAFDALCGALAADD